MKKNNKLNGKDLMNVGIFTAIYFVITCAIAMLGMIPIFMVLLCALVPLIGGIPVMLFYTKVKKPGMIFIMTVIMGLMMFITGMGIYPFLVSIISGLLAELIFKSGNYQSAFKGILAYAVSGLFIWGNYYELFFHVEKYFSTRQDMGQEYIDTLTKLMPVWMCPVLFVVCLVCGIIGGYLGKAVMKKHFVKAGLV